MIKKFQHLDWEVWAKCQQKPAYLNILLDYLNGDANVVRVLKQNEETKISLVATTVGQCVIKDFSPSQKNAERFLKSWLKRDYYVNLFQQTADMYQKGHHTINDFYLLALHKRWHYAQRYIMIIEFIDGHDLPPTKTWDEHMRQQVRQVMADLHQNNVVSGDVHRGNFIQQTADGKIRMIDLSGKRSTAIRQAEDRLKMEQNLGLLNEKQDWAYRALQWRQAWRQKVRKLRGKT